MPEQLLRNYVLTVWEATQPSAGTNKDYALPADTEKLGVSLVYPGTPPGAITLNVQGSNNNSNWTTVGTLNSVAGNSQAVYDFSTFKFVRFNLATFTSPQNITVTAIARN